MKRNVVRGIAVGLIVFPEPVTTAVGAAMLAASYLIPSPRMDTRQRLEGTVRDYLYSYRPLSFPLEKPIISHKLKTSLSPLDMVIPGDPRIA